MPLFAWLWYPLGDVSMVRRGRDQGGALPLSRALLHAAWRLVTLRRMEGGEGGGELDDRMVGLLTVRLLQAYHEGAGGGPPLRFL